MKITDEMVEAGARAMHSHGDEGEWSSSGMRDFYRSYSEAVLTAALAEQQGVEVKKLEWEAYWASTPFGIYTIEDHSGYRSTKRYRLRLPTGSEGDTVLSHGGELFFDDQESAKAAAQSDYETRIRSALVDVPAVESEPVAWMDDGTCRAGSGHTAYRVVTDEQKRGMLVSIAASFTVPLYAHPPRSLSNEGHNLGKLTRPIIGFEHRTPQEVFDIMADRIRIALTTRKGSTGDGSATNTSGGDHG